MHLYHITPRKNLESILAAGLVPSAAKGRRKVVWFCSPSKLAWALHHLAIHHDLELCELAVLCVELLPGEVSRQRAGIYCSTVHIPSWRFC
jgi:hypothetical protein